MPIFKISLGATIIVSLLLAFAMIAGADMTYFVEGVRYPAEAVKSEITGDGIAGPLLFVFFVASLSAGGLLLWDGWEEIKRDRY